jgi:hypothetical protein
MRITIISSFTSGGAGIAAKRLLSGLVKDYEWIMLELYDQTVRNESGGFMKSYLMQEHLPNEDYVYTRIGTEAQKLRKMLISKEDASNRSLRSGQFNRLRKYLSVSNYKKKLKNLLLSDFDRKALAIGTFRIGGEIHQWMYDRYSLSVALRNVAVHCMETGAEIAVEFCY